MAEKQIGARLGARLDAVLTPIVDSLKPRGSAARDSMARLKLMGTLVRLDALYPDGFTAHQLAYEAQVEIETVRSFLKREPAFATEPQALLSSDGPGRPARRFVLAHDYRADLIQQLAAIRQKLDVLEGVASPSPQEIFAPLEQLQETLSELEDDKGTRKDWLDRLNEAKIEFASAMADCQALQSKASPVASKFATQFTLLQERFNQILERHGPPLGETAAHFDIDIERWEKAGQADASVRTTAASLRISFADKVATRHIAPWLKSVREGASLAAYPFALWLTKFWWRLQWEPAALGLAKPSWQTAHELAFATDETFEWPRLVMGSQGESMFAACSPKEHSNSGLRYIESFFTLLTRAEFEFAVDKFVGKTIERVSNLAASELNLLWVNLLRDRDDVALSSYRRFEAMLGLNINEAPAEKIRAVEMIAAKVDSLAVNELVSALGTSREDFNVLISRTNEIMRDNMGIKGKIELKSQPQDPKTTCVTLWETDTVPWEIGRRLARECREAFNFGVSPLSDRALGETLGLTAAQLGDDEPASARGLPFGVAIWNPDTEDANFLFRRSSREERRFEAARFLADSRLSSNRTTWILETDTKTARQQAQRAFAHELLVPFASLSEFLNSKSEDEAQSMREASGYFGVSPIAVQRQLQNNMRQLPLDESHSEEPRYSFA